MTPWNMTCTCVHACVSKSTKMSHRRSLGPFKKWSVINGGDCYLYSVEMFYFRFSSLPMSIPGLSHRPTLSGRSCRPWTRQIWPKFVALYACPPLGRQSRQKDCVSFPNHSLKIFLFSIQFPFFWALKAQNSPKNIFQNRDFSDEIYPLYMWSCLDIWMIVESLCREDFDW